LFLKRPKAFRWAGRGREGGQENAKRLF